MARYLVYIQPAEEGGFGAFCPALPGCVRQGETIEEALEMIREAVEGYVESLRASGGPVPAGLTNDVERVEVTAVSRSYVR